jgi:hypothetical protein
MFIPYYILKNNPNASFTQEQDPVVNAVVNILGFVQAGTKSALDSLQQANIAQLFNLDPEQHQDTARLGNELKAGAEKVSNIHTYLDLI